MTISPLPRAKPNDESLSDEKMRPIAAVVYRALQGAGDIGLSWAEVWVFTRGKAQPGVVITWLRAHGVLIWAFYLDGKTRFKLVAGGA